ncbi:MAG: hypothetical protein GY816_16030 [Cytophagales bacterium]|nr:hypothetical protein [Cytophagales bacterium]
MSYIINYRVALPHYRISDKVLHPRLGRKGQHAICYTDEDIITLAHQAAENLGESVDAVLFATTTPIFKDRYHASYLADLLGLGEGILALDFGTTARAGTDALLMADTLVKSGGTYNNVLVVASDVYYPGIGKETKAPFGHGAVAIIVSSNEGIAEITQAKSYSSSLSEEFKYKGSDTQYDPRFTRTEGFKKNLGLVLKQEEIDPSTIDQVFLNSPYAKIGFGQLKKAGFDLENKLADDQVTVDVGHMGAAHGLSVLTQMMKGTEGTIALFDYLNGTNYIELKTKEIDTSASASKSEPIESYQDYLQLRKQGKFTGKGYQNIDMFSSEMISEREKDTLIHLVGRKCESCGTVYYLKAARCNSCKGSDFKEVQLAKEGAVYSVTSEYYFPNSFGPTNMVVIDLDGGGRITVQQTDDMFPTEDNKIQIGDRVGLVFRKMMENDRKPNYFWKCKRK